MKRNEISACVRPARVALRAGETAPFVFLAASTGARCVAPDLPPWPSAHVGYPPGRMLGSPLRKPAGRNKRSALRRTVVMLPQPKYRRAFVPGGCWFFTINLLERRRRLLTDHIDALREALRLLRLRAPRAGGSTGSS